MTRTYELVFIADPRMSDEDVVALTEDYKGMLTSAGAEITREESWGRRKLAYPLQKLNEGKYVILYVEANGVNPFPEVEQRMRQNDKVLRFLTVRTDPDLKRAESKGRKPKAVSEGDDDETRRRTGLRWLRHLPALRPAPRTTVFGRGADQAVAVRCQ